MIAARHLTKSFGSHRVVDDVSFEVSSGEFVALLGPSGGGKSTVLRIVAGLEHPDEGSVVVRGRDVTHDRTQDRELGFVFQHYALFKHMTVRQNVAFGLEVRKAPRREIDARVDELLVLVQLDGLGDRRPAQLSGGQRQRVALARALAPRPSVMLLDEPFGALDAKVRGDLRKWLRKLQRDQGITSIFVTHDQEEAMELADRVVIIHKGRVEQTDTPDHVYERPATPFVASFIGSSNVLSGVVSAGSATLGAIRVTTPEGADGSDVKAFVRHHEVEIVGPASSTAAESGQLVGIVRSITRVGWVARVELELPDAQLLVAELPKESLERLGVREGESVSVKLRDAKVFVEDYVI
jgi:sulfate transport system ATP-binding protein